MRRLVTAISILFTSCEVIVDVDIPLKQPSITVNSTINPDSTFFIQLTPSQHVLSNDQFLPINGATVNVYDEAGLIETLLQNNAGFYEGTLHPVPGNSYRIEVSHEDFVTVTSTDEVPLNSLSISSISYKNVIVEEFNNEEYTFTVEIEEPKGPNYYEIGLYGPALVYGFDEETGVQVVVDTILQAYYSFSDDPILNRNFSYDGHFMHFSNEIVDGTFSLTFNSYIYSFFNQNVSEVEVIVAIREISPALFRHRQSSNLQWSTNGDPFAEPAPVFSNIENGFGIFGGYHQKTAELVMQRTQ